MSATEGTKMVDAELGRVVDPDTATPSRFVAHHDEDSLTPTPGDPDAWRRLLNFLYLHGQDELFRWR
jgi:hypothetical protein